MPEGIGVRKTNNTLMSFYISIQKWMSAVNWAHLQTFVAVAEHGSLSAAARQLKSSQPTLSRHIAQLETNLGTRLFERSSNGVVLTPEGSDLMA